LNIDQRRAQRESDFYLPLNLKQKYATMLVQGIQHINGRDAYVVVATPAGDLPERLYFDTQTGLPLRKTVALPTPVGPSPSQEDYADYRDTGSGVKFPYTITISPLSPRSVLDASTTLMVTKVEDNVSVDNSQFVKPASRPAPAR
jgi:hypothetical protein